MDSEAALASALACPADALILDLASLEGEARIKARGLAIETLKEPRRARLYLRVGRLDDPEVETDLDAIMAGSPDGVLSPSASCGADVQRLAAKIVVREASFGIQDGATKILAVATESAKAVFGLASYVGCSRRLTGLAFEAEALGADVGARALLGLDGQWIGTICHARAQLLLAAAAARVLAVDAACSLDRGEAAFLLEAKAAWRDGFTAKMAIDPDHVVTINEIFALQATPS